MRNIIKQMPLLLLLFAVLLAFVGCGDIIDDTTPADTPPADTTPNDAGKSGEFVISGEKYFYKNKDVLLLNIENQTDKNYAVTAVVHYFDAEGNELKSQKQTFTGWASGYQNYFLFQPNLTFDTFTYSLELEELSGEECYSKYIVTEFVGLREYKMIRKELLEKGDSTRYPTIIAEYKIANTSTSALAAAGSYVVIDKNGNIYSIEAFDGKYFPQKPDYQSGKLYWEKTTEKLVWPDELTGDVTVIFAVTSVKIS